MTTLYVGNGNAYRDEVSIARAESAHAAVHAPRAEVLEWDAQLLFLVRWDGNEHYATDVIDVHKILDSYPEADVRIIPIR